MTLPLVFRSGAQAEFDTATAWYEDKRPGLGWNFVAEVHKTLNSIASNPDRYPVVDGDVREALLGRFPYCIYYRVKPNRVVIIAVFHTSRDPFNWHDRK